MSTPAFGGIIGDDWRSSTEWWAPDVKPPDDAPNVVLIVLDDVGFGQLGCYGSGLSTPRIDALANQGVRLANFHTTALCSPTRSCLLTGRNHHRNGLGRVADLAMGYPGYNGVIPIGNGFVSETLRANGYATYAVGKWHLTADDEATMAGDRRSWPLGRGFDRWYGFHGGETHQFVPSLYHDNHAVHPETPFSDDYHLTTDLADHAIRFVSDLRNIDPDRRFFTYFATGACHSPHHAPPDFLARERGRFDSGWDVWREEVFARQIEAGFFPPGTEMAPRPPWVPAWDDLDADTRAVAARFMECFAAFLAHTDAQIGRFLDFLEETGDAANTLVVLVSDNGASGEGGRDGSLNDVRQINFDFSSPRELIRRIDEIGTATTHNNYPWGWTMAGNTPFKRWKREVHEGGVADPCIVRWPGRVAGDNALRHQYAHAVDIATTIFDLCGIDAPSTIDSVPQSPLDGVSLASILGPDGAQAPAPRVTQYFEMLGSRAIYHDGWKAVTFKSVGPVYGDEQNWNAPFDQDEWELYHVAEDPTELVDLAGSMPEKLSDLVARWWDEARANQVLPLDNRPLHTLAYPKPNRARDRRISIFRPHGAPVPEAVTPNVKNRQHTITAAVRVRGTEPAEGVLLAQGSVLGGFSFQLFNGRLRYVHNLYGKRRTEVSSPETVPPGDHLLQMRFDPGPDGGGWMRLFVDADQVAEAELAKFTVMRFSHTGAGLTCGYEHGPAIGDGYAAPFRCTEVIHRVTLEVGDPVVEDPVIAFERIMSEQ